MCIRDRLLCLFFFATERVGFILCGTKPYKISALPTKLYLTYTLHSRTKLASFLQQLRSVIFHLLQIPEVRFGPSFSGPANSAPPTSLQWPPSNTQNRAGDYSTRTCKLGERNRRKLLAAHSTMISATVDSLWSGC